MPVIYISKEYYDIIVETKRGIAVNEYIKKAIKEKLIRDKLLKENL